MYSDRHKATADGRMIASSHSPVFFMNRATLTLLISCGSLAALLVMTKPANAAPAVTQIVNPVMSVPTASAMDRHRVNLSIGRIAQESNPILDLLGCSCAACTKTLIQM